MHSLIPSFSDSTALATNESQMTEVSKSIPKTPKSVRFDTNDSFGDDESFDIPTPMKKPRGFSCIGSWLRNRFKSISRSLKVTKRKMERPLIAILMKMGY